MAASDPADSCLKPSSLAICASSLWQQVEDIACEVQTTLDTDVAASEHTDCSWNELSVCVHDEVNAIIHYASANVEPWIPESYDCLQRLQEAPRNHGRVDLMRSLENGGQFVAVKRMPNAWVTGDQHEFNKLHPRSQEQPWVDIGITGYLQGQGFPVCELQGLFRDQEFTYVVATFATYGDLFKLLKAGPQPGVKREDEIRPLMTQVFKSVQWLHNLGVAHRDLSLENIVLADDGQGPAVKLIDFGMATISRDCTGVCGKATYIAPEMYTKADYDPFLGDVFALGVMLFTIHSTVYPWESTAPNRSQVFKYVQDKGFRAMLMKKKAPSPSTSTLAETFSEGLVEALEGTLALDPARRLTLGEQCWQQERAAVWGLRFFDESR